MLKSLFKTQNVCGSKNSYFILNKFSTSGKVDKPKRPAVDLTDEENVLRSVFSSMRNTVLSEGLCDFSHKPEYHARFTKLIDHTVNHKRLYLASPLMIVRSYKYLEKPYLQTEDNLRKAAILGWGFKLIEAGLTIMDDILDEGILRYNKPTWNTIVGNNNAMLDACFLISGAKFLLNNYIPNHPHYVKIQNQFIKCCCSIQISEMMETSVSKLEEIKQHENIIKAYSFTVYLLNVCLYFADICDEHLHKASHSFCLELAKYLKNQDDAKVITTTTEDTEKMCTDARLGRPSWLILEALERCTPAQKKTLGYFYDQHTQESAVEIYNIYKELKLKEAFEEYEDRFYENMLEKIKKLPQELPKELFLDFLNFAVSGDLRS